MEGGGINAEELPPFPRLYLYRRVPTFTLPHPILKNLDHRIINITARIIFTITNTQVRFGKRITCAAVITRLINAKGNKNFQEKAIS